MNRKSTFGSYSTGLSYYTPLYLWEKWIRGNEGYKKKWKKGDEREGEREGKSK